MNHLRRRGGGYTAPVNSAGASEVDYGTGGTGGTGGGSVVLYGAPRSLLPPPKTSSPATGGLPPSVEEVIIAEMNTFSNRNVFRV